MLKELTTDQIISLAFIGSHFSGIAHNINTPLSAVMGRMELLHMRLDKIGKAAELSSEELEKCLNDIAIVSQCCLKIDETLKNCVKTSYGILQSTESPIQLDMLLQGMLAFLNADMEYKHQTIKEFDFNSAIPPVKGDPVAFSAAFFEILNNARLAMQNAAEKKLTITVSAADSLISIVIQDTGCGIAEDCRSDLLRLLASSQQAQEGAGRESGLQRVARLLQPYGVTYDIQSRPGDTVFKLNVPVHN